MMPSPVRFLLLLIAACAAGTVAILALVPSSWEAPQPQLPELSGVSLAALADEEASVIDFGQVAARPLFIAGRRPWIEPAAVAKGDPEPEPDPFPEADLVGIFGSGGDAGVIVSMDGEASRVRVGAEWSGWTLRAVDPGGLSATFEASGRRSHELKLKRQPQQGAMVFQAAQPEAAAEPEAEAESGEARDDSAQEGAESTRARRQTNRNRSSRDPSARAR